MDDLCVFGDGEAAVVGLPVEDGSKRLRGVCFQHMVKFCGSDWRERLPGIKEARHAWSHLVSERNRLRWKPVRLFYPDTPMGRLLVWLGVEWLERKVPSLGCCMTVLHLPSGQWEIALLRDKPAKGKRDGG